MGFMFVFALRLAEGNHCTETIVRETSKAKNPLVGGPPISRHTHVLWTAEMDSLYQPPRSFSDFGDRSARKVDECKEFAVITGKRA